MHQTQHHSPVCPARAAQIEAFGKYVMSTLILQLVCSVAPPLFKLTPNLFTQKVESSSSAGQGFYILSISTSLNFLPNGSNWSILIVNGCVLGERQSLGVLPDCREVGNWSSVGLTSFLENMQSLTLPSAQQGRKVFLWLIANFEEMSLYFWTLHLEFQLIF